MIRLSIDSLHHILNTNKPLIFLDSALSSYSDRYSYLFFDPVMILKTNKYSNVSDILKKIDNLAKQYWLAGYITYEASYGLEEKLSNTFNLSSTSQSDLIWFGVFENPHRFDHKIGKWFPDLESQSQYYIKPDKYQQTNKRTGINLSFCIDFETYAKKIRKIKMWIGKGHTYQVNFTFNVIVNTKMSNVELYLSLREKQKTPYCAFINTGDEHILSFSPEMFFRKIGSQIRVKPMKGTAPRGRWDKEDKELKVNLQNDTKNKSENLMIVDLLRNDLGRICEIGSVKTLRLYEVETHRTLHQMTSTIQGKLKRNVGFHDIFQHIFPSGSVTGAPKIRTMQIIHSLEEEERGVYCGAIGYISPKRKAVFSVPIRTMHRKHRSKKWIYHVGSGILWDSTTKTEWDECKTKCKFLTATQFPEFEIFESILWDRRLVYLKNHILRLKKSAKFFEYPILNDNLQKVVMEIERTLKDNEKYKVRIFLNKNGNLRWDYEPLDNSQSQNATIAILSKTTLDENNIFLYHKTTHRPWYLEAMEKIRKGLCYDVIFHNSKDEITEGARTNIFIEKDKMLYTPPPHCGLLPGILREILIQNKKCVEKTLTLKDLKTANAVYCGNSVRGLQKVILKTDI